MSCDVSIEQTPLHMTSSGASEFCRAWKTSRHNSSNENEQATFSMWSLAFHFCADRAQVIHEKGVVAHLQQ